MKENQHYRRFDFFSALAVLGTLAVLLLEMYFIFELYNRDLQPDEQAPPAVEEPAPVG